MDCSSSASDLSLDDENPDLELESGMVFTRLNKVVREQYFGFLLKLLKENYATWCTHANQVQQEQQIEDCAKQLEEKAIESCMMVQIYRKAMVKIIANVRRSTEQHRLQHNLRTLIENSSMITAKILTHQSKSTQTDKENCTKAHFKSQLSADHDEGDEFVSPALQRKIEMFQEKLNSETAAIVASKKCTPKTKLRRPKRKHRQTTASTSASRKRHSSSQEQSCLEKTLTCSPGIFHVSPSPPRSDKKDNDDEDLVAQELAQLFSEEKNEIDEIFGFVGNDQNDDPQINSILKEIQNAKLPNEQKLSTTADVVEQLHAPVYENPIIKSPTNQKTEKTYKEPRNKVDLRHSLWPCELYMQRRHLSEILSRLIEEDIRWHDIMKWKFVTLFGEDSDDEFASCSPSIELNEELICSCIKRISPWVVKHLMKPMNDGLIANRFLFKKLARKLSRLIIMENQYPDEKMIDTVVENFFCIRQAVQSTEDLDLPFFIYSDNTNLFAD